MKQVVLLFSAAVACMPVSRAFAETSILFIGNSFTFGAGSPVKHYRFETVTDLNGQDIGGMPALFRSFADQAGIDYDVFVETQPGSGLDYHLENKQGVIGRRGWDSVVMHGYSTLDPEQPRDPAKLIETSRQMADFLRERNADVNIYLLATWSRADQTYPATGAWAGEPIDAMALDVREAYDMAREAADATRVIPVGQAWNRAMRTGVADQNPYDGVEFDKLNLWTYDHYHASAYGYYLEALVVFGTLSGQDPRRLGEQECSAYELGFSRSQTSVLQQIAYEELVSEGVLEVTGSSTPAATPGRCAAVR
jgi:hypothetical protein